MTGRKLSIAAGNQLGAEAAAAVALGGGNAVDACLASAIAAWVSEPFFASLAGSGFVAVRTPDGTVEVIDGNSGMPHTVPDEPGQGWERAFLPNYADGIYVGVGPGSVAVPGVLAAIHKAWERHGRIEWPALFETSISAAREGIAFPKTSAYYLSATYEEVWSLYPESRDLFAPNGEQLGEGAPFVQDELADALEMVATQGPDVFYSGELGKQIVEELQREGGFLQLSDLESYEALVRRPVETDAFGWRIEANPPPSVGGATLTHLLALLADADLDDPVKRLSAIVEAQGVSMGYRRERYGDPSSVAAGLEEALAQLKLKAPRSSSTTHTSSADSDGYVCAITESNGYGAGLVIHGVMMNDTLGEEELNPMGIHRLPPGSRCHSNMTPTIASGPELTVGLGSPGADRIVSAIAQTLLRLAADGDSLEAAVAGPRAYLDLREQGETLCYEPGLPGDLLGYIPRPYEEIHMFFGGVQAAAVDKHGNVDAVHDPRRSGASLVV
jgi:gamma-glutamyltranspeptidase / glutathione hydrolase